MLLYTFITMSIGQISNPCIRQVSLFSPFYMPLFNCLIIITSTFIYINNLLLLLIFLFFLNPALLLNPAICRPYFTLLLFSVTFSLIFCFPLHYFVCSPPASTLHKNYIFSRTTPLFR